MEANRELGELIEALRNIQNASLITRLREVFDDMIASDSHELSADQKKMLDTRIEKYRSGKATTFTLEEVRRKFQHKMGR